MNIYWFMCSTEFHFHAENSTISYSDSKPDPIKDDLAKSHTTEAVDELPQEGFSIEKKKTAKIHDFCLGIPFGAIVLSGGLIGYLFSRNLATLGTGFLFGLPLLSLSCFSLKVWRNEISSLPFILGQGALAAALFWKHFQTYSSVRQAPMSPYKEILLSGFYALLSGAMLCFYSYVLLSGGNPPPKVKAAAAKSA
ncbi:unnamed protein product [Spirodela intermedia]|uniref:Uncharacterized protein n=1 Tax=Spirodela intermedia TaxID=51605 RepID=A0A7I8JNH1_SPIIN|nr:unnamed protein product [Spirodela intermedia]CAA6671689.1 unnamed protein product [Spirodela intermedia]